MTRQRGPLYLLLSVVAVAAAVLSFAALRDLARLCGFTPALAWLLPVVVDAGAAAGSIVWLARWTPPAATAYGRALALLLLASSVGGNALGHGLDAYQARPHWLVVVGVSAIAPAVLGALVHLVVLVGRPIGVPPAVNPQHEVPDVADVAVSGDLPTHDERKTPANSAERAPLHSVPAAVTTPTTSARVDDESEVLAQVRDLVAAGNGRPAIARTLGVKDHVARALMAKAAQ